MAEVVVDQALTPLRDFVNETVPKLNEAVRSLPPRVSIRARSDPRWLVVVTAASGRHCII